jgi:methyltransferase
MAVSTKALELFAVAGACLVYYLNLAIEYRRHLQNSKMLKFAGFEIEQSLWHKLYYLLIGVGPLALVYIAISASSESMQSRVLMVLPILFVAQLLRGGAIAALGNGWIMGFVWNNEWKLVEQGPYRWLRHPEYVARWLDLLGFALLVGSSHQAAISLMAALSLLTIRICRWETAKMNIDVIAKGLSNPTR